MFHKPIMSAAINPFESEQRAVSISTNQKIGRAHV